MRCFDIVLVESIVICADNIVWQRPFCDHFIMMYVYRSVSTIKGKPLIGVT